ncbi:membrane protein [Paraburkholderia sp. PGU19]|uniref:YadA-like family protein n=1 Tax=Paraburkholderia sp. PGU19 TaxID=2735434 RepID=UPI0015D9D706|nr:YadA-like family protein [Paraburkholderia sp. PGU19]BCF99461.1 membrane protein [Paraburkholderia sp. PGU19]
MNKTYRSVWNESTGTWVAAQENATGKKKKARSILAGSAGFVVATSGIIGVGVLGAASAQASQVCVTSSDGKAKASFSYATGSLVATGCGANANNILASGHDLGIVEAQSSAMWVDGTSQTINFRSGGANGKLVQLTTDARLTGLSAGINDSDAVTVSQLNSAIGSGSTKYFHANSTQTDSLASGSESIAVGVAAVSSGASSIAQGVMASASGDSSVALGAGANATGPKAVALGSGSVANSSTLGSAGFNPGSTALSAGTASGELSIGGVGSERRITNVAAGYSATDAVNVSQLMSEDAKVNSVSNNVSILSNTVNNIGGSISNINNQVTNITNGGGIKYFHANSTLADSVASGVDSVAIGGGALANKAGSMAIGANAKAGNGWATGDIAIGSGAQAFLTSNTTGAMPSVALGYQANANGDGIWGANTVVGGYATASSFDATAIGYSTNASSNAVAVGYNSTASANSVAIGYVAKTTGTSAIALGQSALAAGNNGIALGTSASATTANSVALGSNSVANSTTLGSAGFAPGGATLSAATAFGEVSVGASAKERRITNVAAGYAATDAVNVSQLMAEDARVNLVNNNLSNLTNVVNNIPTSASLKYFHANSTLADSTVTGVNSVAAGPAAVASANNAVALGANSVADRANTVSVGSSTAQRQIANLAAGTANTDAVNVSQLSGVTQALGGGASMKADGSIAPPTYNVYGNTYSNVGDALGNISSATSNIVQSLKYIKFGDFGTAAAAQASGIDTIALGGNANASQNGAIAIGRSAVASAVNSVALGYGSLATQANTFSVGNAVSQRRITNVADGIDSHDAATVGQVTTDIQAAIANLNTTTNSGLLKSAVRSSSLLGATPTSSLTPDQLIASGPLTSTSKIEASGTNSVAIGLNTFATADSSVAIGNNVQALSPGAVAIGQQAHTDGVNTVAIGSDASALADNAIAIGNNSTAVVAGATNGVAIGNNVTIGGVNSMGIGANIVASGSNSVTLGYGSADGGRSNVLSVGNTKSGGQRQIINVAAGTQKTDAVNVSQLTGVTAALGGGATVNTDGSIKAPTYSVQGTTATDVGTAISKLDGAVSNVSNNVTNLTQNFNNVVNGGGIKYFHANSAQGDSSASGAESVAIGGGAIASTSNSVALGSGSVASSGALGVKGFAPDNAALTAGTAFGELSVGTSGKERRITNVAAGYSATDAVNVSQLMAEDAKVNNVSSNLSNLSNVVNNIGTNVSMKYFHANSSLNDSTASGINAIAVGPQATAAGTNAIAVGYNASATAAESVALGSNSTTTANLSATAYNPGSGALPGTTASGEVSVGNGSFNRRITNVAAGSAATDAVNVSQLMAENAKVNAEGTATAAALGGGSSYDSTTGNISAPTYTAGNIAYNNVAGAITNIDARLSNITGGTGDGIKYFHANSTLGDSSASGKDSVAIGGAATASTANSVALGSNSLANSSTLGSAGFAPGGATLSGATAFGEVSVGAQGKERRITNVAAGYAATDAVNVSQLMAEDVKVNNLSNTVNNIANGGANMKYFNVSSSLAAASANGADSVAAGPGAVVLSTASGSVALGANSVADRANTVSVGSAGSRRQIVNVAAGIQTTDAVNVSQLSGVTQALGGGASVKADGSIAQPMYNVYGNTYSNVGDALGNISSATGNIVQSLKYIKFGDFGNAAAAQASMADTIAFGGNANASQNGAIAIGRSAVASAVNSVALGYGSVANQAYTFSVGNAISQRRITNVADGVDDHDAVTVGQMTMDIQAAIANLNTTTHSGLLKSAVGPSSLLGAPPVSSLTPDQLIASGPLTSASVVEASGTNSVAIGLNTFATADSSVAIGNNVQALSSGAVAIGQQAHTDGVNTVAIGSDASALADSAIAIGNHSTAVVAGATNGIAIGNNVTIGGVNSMGIGANIVAQGSNSVTLGYGSADGGRANVLSVGNTKSGGQRQIINVAAGTQNNDAVNVSQLAGVASALGGGASVNPTTGAIVAPAYALAGNTYVNVAAALTSLDTRIASGGDPLAVDYDSSTKDVISLKGATGTKITGLTAGALNASSTEAINGSQLYAQGTSMAKALGGGASVNTATGEITAPAYTFGGGTYTNVADALTALNNAAGSGNALGVVYDDQDKTQITLAGSTGTKITKVAAGDVNASSTDAMNGTQLYNVAASTADAIGGGSSFDPSTGKITNPTFNIGGKTITNIAGAITNLDDRVYANATDITNLQTQINEGGIGLVTQDATSRNILVASQTDGSIVDFAGTKGARRLTGVAAGIVNASSFDAVNGTQLYNVAVSTASVIGGGSTVKTDGTISNPTYIVGGSTVTTIGGAITNLDARVYANSTDITNLQTQINEGGIGLVTQDATSKNILVASKTDGSIVDFTGKDGARVLTGVAAGTGDSDAVNVAQLKAAGIINPDGVTKTAVTYDTTTDNTGKTVTDYTSVTLGDGTSTSKPVAIHNVADGSAPNDAVNYSQYADLVSKVNSISNAGTGVDTLFVGDGDRNTEQAQAGGTHATAMGALSVANGLQSVATGYASSATGSNAVAIGANSTASGNNSVALGANSVASEDNTVSVGSASQQRRVTNVAAGTATTDAVNVGQLNDAITNASNNTVNQAVQQSNSYTDSQFNKMNDKMNSLGAAAMAATSLIPNARAEGNFQMSAAAGTYGGAAAVAVGANYWVNDRVLVNAHVTRATGNGANTGASAGVTIGF